MSRKLVITCVVFALLALAATALLRPRFRSSAGVESADKSIAPPRGRGAALRVTAVTIMPEPFAETVLATGTLRAAEGVELQAEANGKVVAINFQEGVAVRKGDLLVKLNDSDLRAMLERALSRRDVAAAHERRLAKLLESHSARQEDYEAALSELNVQRAEVALAEAQIAKTEIRAPFDGVAGLRFVSEGAFVTPATRVATLQNLENIKLDFSVPEKYANRIRLGGAIDFTVPGAERKFRGKIYAIDPRIDPGTRTVVLRAIAPNPDGKLLPGGFASVELALDAIPDALLVPAIAVVPGVSEKEVFVIENGKAARRTVQTGTRGDTSVHILEGLKPGDLVITSGLQQLRAGLPVVMIDSESVSEKSASAPPLTAAKSAE